MVANKRQYTGYLKQTVEKSKESTVYKENIAPVLFSPFLPSDRRANLNLG